MFETLELGGKYGMEGDGQTIKHPNLLFVFVDQMRYEAMVRSGNDQVHTPNLGRMA